MGKRVIGYTAAAAIVAMTSLGLQAFSANASAAAPVLLLVVVVVARLWRLGPALLAAAAGGASLSYYFLPPAGFGIEDTDDWIAFLTFIVTAIIAGELASRAERRAVEAQEGRHEIERLYQELQAAFDRASEAEAARRSEQLKAALLDALTHNLRTPLTAIKAAVTALIGVGASIGAWRLTSEGELELLQVIDEESDRLNRFIEGLSTASAAVDGRPQFPAVPLKGIVNAGLARAETLTRDHRVVVDLTDPLPLVAVDPAAVAEVLYILLDNASKYAPSGTTIRISADPEDAQHVRVAVSDQGPGIPPELRERVFEKFYRIAARAPRSTRQVGAGLGLPIARRLIETQGGQVWIEAPPGGVGTMVVLRLPVAAAHRAESRTPVVTMAAD